MGNRVIVELKDLPPDWRSSKEAIEVFDHRCDQSEWCECQGQGCYIEKEELWIQFPFSGWVLSNSTSELVLDCKDTNTQFVEELKRHNVTFKLQ